LAYSPIKNAKNNEHKTHQLPVHSFAKSKLGQLLLANRSTMEGINPIKNHTNVVRGSINLR